MKNNAIVSCGLKKYYNTKEEVEQVIDYLWLEKQIQVESYKCNICDGFHLTNKKGR